MAVTPDAKREQISETECGAMRLLDDDPDYSRTVLAMMFNCGDTTVARHVNGECTHFELQDGIGNRRREWTDAQLHQAWAIINRQCNYRYLGQSLYNELAPEHFPAAQTISKHLSWPPEDTNDV